MPRRRNKIEAWWHFLSEDERREAKAAQGGKLSANLLASLTNAGVLVVNDDYSASIERSGRGFQMPADVAAFITRQP